MDEPRYKGVTLLGADQSTEEKQKQAKIELDWARFCILLDIAYEHYTSVDTKPDLVKFCKMIVQISEDFEGDRLERIPDRGRHRLVGEWVEKAVRFDRHRMSADGRLAPMSDKRAFGALVRELVEMAHQNGHPMNKTRQTQTPTAFEFVSELIYKYGISNDGEKYSPNTIANWK